MARESLLRQWRIVEALHGRKRGVTVKQLLEAVSTSKATLYRDLALLQEAGIPLSSAHRVAVSICAGDRQCLLFAIQQNAKRRTQHDTVIAGRAGSASLLSRRTFTRGAIAVQLSQQQKQWLNEALGLEDGQEAFPWQLNLLRCFLRQEFPRSLDIPTGLGKTAVIAIWLIARACDARVPRRLVYVVDRRAVVDQATEVASQLREFVANNAPLRAALNLDDASLPISTLRGQFVDNKEWLADPSAPAIVVGTVDMVGSRLLFQG